METFSVAPSTERMRALILDGQPRSRSILTHILEQGDYDTVETGNAHAALGMLAHAEYAIIVVDGDTIDLAALSAVANACKCDSAHRLLVLASRPIPGFDCLLKPFASSDLLAALALAKGAIAAAPARQRLIGRSPVMQQLFGLMDRVAPTRATVLIQGETGTGKELVARAIHDLSPRAGMPFVPVSCSALPETLLESELFGHTRGSFTGAIANRRGLIEEAHGGTLFLDEISTVPLAVQVKLLRVLQDRVIQRVGSSSAIPVDFRLLVAANVELAAEVSAGRFREDLYYRLNVFPLSVPPLRDRVGDVPLLISHYRLKYSRDNNLPAPNIDPELLGRLSAYEWPGNVRELENFVERTVIMQAVVPPRTTDPPLPLATLTPAVVDTALDEKWDLARLEREYTLRVLALCKGHRAQAARILGIDARTLYRKLKSWH